MWAFYFYDMTYNGDLSMSFSISSFGIVFVLFVGAINDW